MDIFKGDQMVWVVWCEYNGVELMHRFVELKQGIHSRFRSRIHNTNNNRQEKDKQNGFDSKGCLILVKETENTATG